jgi:hypothetical protein
MQNTWLRLAEAKVSYFLLFDFGICIIYLNVGELKCILSPCVNGVVIQELITCSNEKCLSCRVCKMHVVQSNGYEMLLIHCVQMLRDNADEGFLAVFPE